MWVSAVRVFGNESQWREKQTEINKLNTEYNLRPNIDCRLKNNGALYVHLHLFFPKQTTVRTAQYIVRQYSRIFEKKALIDKSLRATQAKKK
jgi:hypothetical protein